MDERLRDLERQAKSGDASAAHRWFVEVCRSDDLMQQYEAMMKLCELHHPGLMQQLQEINELLDTIRVQEVEIEPSGKWTTEPSITYNTHGDVTNQRHDLQTVTAVLGSSRSRVQLPTSSSSNTGR